MDAVVADLSQGLYCSHALAKEGKKQVNIPVICLDRIFCEPFLSDQVVEEKLFGGEELFWEGLAGDGRILPEKSV